METLIQAITELVKEGGTTAVYVVLILQLSSLLKYPLTFLGLWVLIKTVIRGITTWIEMDSD